MQTIGFTGTKNGMTPSQWTSVLDLITKARDDEINSTVEVHHGDCVGADAQFDSMARIEGCRRVIHPPTNPKGRAFCTGDEVLKPRPYLDHNHDIVDAVAEMIATPSSRTEMLRGSGTWATIRYARKHLTRVKLTIIWPDGSKTTE